MCCFCVLNSCACCAWLASDLLMWTFVVQDDFFEEALGLHREGDQDKYDGFPPTRGKVAKVKAQEISKKQSKGFSVRRGMGNKAKLKR